MTASAEAAPTPPETRAWEPALLTPPETRAWEAALLTPPETRAWEPALLTPPETRAWEPALLTPPETRAWEPALLTPPETRAWEAALLTPQAPLRVLGDDRIRIGGQHAQGVARLSGSPIAQRHRDIPQQAASFRSEDGRAGKSLLERLFG